MSPEDIARALAALRSIAELEAYAEQAHLRGLFPGEAAAIAARRFDLLGEMKRRGRA